MYKDLGDLGHALKSTLRSLDLKPSVSDTYMNLGGIYQDIGDLNQALESTLKSIELNSKNTLAYINLGHIYLNLGSLEQAHVSALKALEVGGDEAKSLYLLGSIKLRLGNISDGKKTLWEALQINENECGAYYELSLTMSTSEEAETLLQQIKSINTISLGIRKKSMHNFAISNCLHKLGRYEEAAKFLKNANNDKLVLMPSDAYTIIDRMKLNLPGQSGQYSCKVNVKNGKGRIFIVGMPRSGSTLLETVLASNPQIHALGEVNSLAEAIERFLDQDNQQINKLSLHCFYSLLMPLEGPDVRYTVDKQLCNFLYIDWIITHFPSAKIIYCKRNALDNVLSMFRSNLVAGNNFTSNLEDAATILVEQLKVLSQCKRDFPSRIFTFNYDAFVNNPKNSIIPLLSWLNLEWSELYLRPEKINRTIKTASFFQSRLPINNKSVGGWVNYKAMLKPAIKILKAYESAQSINI